MDAAKPSPTTTDVSGILHALAKVLRLRKSGVAPDDGIQKVKLLDPYVAGSSLKAHLSQCRDECDREERLRRLEAMEVLLARVFACISAIKAAYAQLQAASAPYDPDRIQSADETVVSELKSLSELKHCYLKKQILDLPSHHSQLSAESREQQNLLKTYEIVLEKLQSELQLKESEVLYHKEKLQDLEKQCKALESRLSPTASLSFLDNLHISALNPTHFIRVYGHTVKSIRSFVKLMIERMHAAGWDIGAAADAIEPLVRRSIAPAGKALAFESYVCRKMFAGFQEHNFSVPVGGPPDRRRHEYFAAFMELKSRDPIEFLAREKGGTGTAAFGEFCRLKYLSLVHPKMEASLFGDVRQRNAVRSGELPATPFMEAFAEMAKRVWVLHSLGRSFKPAASVFQARRGSRFSEVYMAEEGCAAGALAEQPAGADARVGFTVVPGFIVGRTVVQCRVFL